MDILGNASTQGIKEATRIKNEQKKPGPGAVIFVIILWLVIPSLGTAAEIVDNDGTLITFEQPFSRIISLYAAHTENLVRIGAGETLVATSRSDSFSDLPRLGYKDDPERFIALKPDLLLIRPMISRSYPKLVRRLREVGITVVSLQPVSVDQMFNYWRSLGILCGHESQAEKMIQTFRDKLQALSTHVAAIPEKSRKRVYFEAIHQRMKTFAPSSIAMFVLNKAGGINVADDTLKLRNTNIARYGKERILAKADEIDVFLAQQGRMNPVTREIIINEPGFQVIKAVREDAVYLIDERIVCRPTFSLLKGIQTIYTFLYGQPQK